MMSALFVGFLLDLLIGDPLWLPHPVQAMGWLVAKLEGPLRRVFPQTERGALAAGGDRWWPLVLSCNSLVFSGVRFRARPFSFINLFRR